MLNKLRLWAALQIFKILKHPDLSSSSACKIKLSVTFEIDSEDNVFDSRGSFSNDYDISSVAGLNKALDAVLESYNQIYTRLLRARWYKR